MAKWKDNLIVKLLLGVIVGIIVGLYANEQVIGVINTIKFLIGQIIFFIVPLIILGFITPAITKMKSNASKMLGTMLGLSYSSSVGAALFSMIAGYILIPKLNIVTAVEGLKEIPALVFKVEIPPVVSVMTALVLSIVVGLAVIWTNSKKTEELLEEFNEIMLSVVYKIVIPILPIFIASTFATLSYEGSITKQFPVFLKVIVIVLVGHYIWLAVLYLLGGAVSGKNPWNLLKHYGPAYLTAVGTMSSAATLPVALSCAKKSNVLHDDVADFAIPLGATTHLCGSVLTEVFFVMTVSKILYGSLPSVGTMILFVFLLGIFAVGAPGVPGGTVMASLGIIISVVGFDETGTALMLTIFALQDSFGTACNVTGDGALALILNGIFKKDLAEKN
ncbi:sodium:dicarboxylate symporter [Fusobacterium necrophorum subsp. funduliforme]|uniref:Transporter, dicarboxylate/amino acid:cation Na+/H+ symporter family protein n=2 Tax=Fusobacterium necrophorum TaxID=859 RepID=A0AAN3VWM4_9FUSO|nr:dicarboxylate/amino acid:cation symporter [Fusobacterium necrophorum]AYV95318.1 dicarboxylate/amino acid:cation symporter [Fusobacterium necrophorum subsp. funduliforme]EFS23799.2 transporter, dicarboxylate/amino acid:cation Na+/H+ symporter family protein [Fusobacterium necrophorum D12]EJU18528.1 transporter, dicarboxylate/amino acid:cation Na+/H+ symporter family protein [Fusobacterium necrophorum subsp. funduliforme Fnf 1007]KYL00047.1 sodium:dicarboxylate symporter [Fusobacterium necroph